MRGVGLPAPKFQIRELFRGTKYSGSRGVEMREDGVPVLSGWVVSSVLRTAADLDAFLEPYRRELRDEWGALPIAF